MDQDGWDELLSKINATRIPWSPLSRELVEAKKNFESLGKGATWADVQKLKNTWRSVNPFIDSDGKSFVLYIYDQAGTNYRRWSRYGNTGQREYKFHFSWCNALQTMSAAGRARYKQKKDVDNDIFTVNRGAVSDEQVRLRVCKFCLSQMSYQGYSYNDSEEKKSLIYNSFQIGVFFAEHTVVRLPQPTHQHHSNRYTSDWSEISRRIRNDRGNRCEDVGPHSGELHVHHINGVKSDNRPVNLKVLCHSCHSKQPMHEHMQGLRREIA